jgi:DNA-binding MarR family transcriptional regulator
MERQTKGIWIPIEIWEDKNLSWNERILLLEIDSFTTKDKDCFISNEYIANLLNVSETTANKILSSLIKKGYVIKTAFDGRRRYVKSALQLKTIQPCTLEQPCLALYDNILNTSNNTIKEDNIIILSKKAEDNAEHANVNPLLEYNNGVKKCSKKSNNVNSDIDYLYDLYPTKCPNRGRSTGKCRKDKEKIKSLLKNISKDELEFTIKSYVKQQTDEGGWLKNFSTFLNQLPDMGYGKDSNIIEGENSNSSYIAKRLQELDEKIEKYK